MKTCTKCKRTLPEAEYYKDIRAKDRLMSACKQCFQAANAAWRQAHKEHNKKYFAKYGAANKEKIRKYDAKYYTEHREKIRKRQAKYLAEHLAEYRRHQLKRRYKEKLKRGKSYADWERALRAKRFFVCYWCKQRKPISVLHIDHIIPICKGGIDGLSNVVPSCAHCNITKGGRDLKVWAPSVGMLAI